MKNSLDKLVPMQGRDMGLEHRSEVNDREEVSLQDKLTGQCPRTY